MQLTAFTHRFARRLDLKLLRSCLALLAVLFACDLVPSVNSQQNSPQDPLQTRIPLDRGFLILRGESINLTCPFNVPFYSWTRSDQPSKILSDNQFFRIRSATLEDSGRYSCSAVDGYGHNSAKISIRVIDRSSYTAQRECVLDSDGAVNRDGPCFLVSYSDLELNPTRAWGDSIILDCDTVAASGIVEGLVYRWEVTYSRPLGMTADTAVESNQRLLARAPVLQTSPSGSKTALTPTSLDIRQYNEPQLRIEKLNLGHSGEYRCVVTDTRRPSALGAPARMNTLSRTFRLSVKPRTEGPIIQGPRIINETVVAGQDAVFRCEVDPEEHRSSTIRWGKSIDAAQRANYEAEGREVIQWAGGTFVVLPSIPNSAVVEEKGMLFPVSNADEEQGKDDRRVRKLGRTTSPLIPSTGAVATEASGSQSSKLWLRNPKSSDSGRYVCSVLTEAGRDDHKFVWVSVIGSADGETEELVGHAARRLAVYIAVPTAVFILCLCVVTYCLLSRRASRSNRLGHRRQRNYYGQTQPSQLKSPSAASSSSVGVCRNGIGTGGGGWTSAGDPRLRPSPAGTTSGTGALAYSSTNGSNSISGAGGQVVVPTATYQTGVPGTVAMVPGSYPMLLQSMAPQSGPPYYAVQDGNAVTGYPQTVYPVSTGSGADYVLTNNTLNTYPPGGVAYPISNGHPPGRNGSNLAPSTMLNSSPDSSAITGAGSPMNSEVVEGRLVFQPPPGQPQQQPQQVFPTFPGAVTTGGGFGYHAPPQSQMSSNTGEFDLGQSNTPLIPYHTHADNAHNPMRA
ncbi:unnamed protein product [Calicophoron daubneyi]|uniref:Ig-like domain-containing protein n=1 Tax=Calicophoron daubneyi TaxID=300641 RepID=A0AAV2TRW7_CALDB